MSWREPATVASARRLAASKLGSHWIPLGRIAAWRYNRELKYELSPGHVMGAERWSAIARDSRSDDVVFASESGRLAKVHLTWSHEKGAGPPSASLVSSFEEIADREAEEDAYVAHLIAEDERQVAGTHVEIEAVCAHCGANWSAGEARSDCPVCDGFALVRPCPVCGGRCGAQWQRAVIDSNESGTAHWIGKCAGSSQAR